MKNLIATENFVLNVLLFNMRNYMKNRGSSESI